MPKADWTRVEYWACKMGEVRYQYGDGTVDAGWKSWVKVGDKLIAVQGVFDSASVGMGVVERVWKREEEKRNGTG